jgi:hypothetical protein
MPTNRATLASIVPSRSLVTLVVAAAVSTAGPGAEPRPASAAGTPDPVVCYAARTARRTPRFKRVLGVAATDLLTTGLVDVVGRRRCAFPHTSPTIRSGTPTRTGSSTGCARASSSRPPTPGRASW